MNHAEAELANAINRACSYAYVLEHPISINLPDGSTVIGYTVRHGLLVRVDYTIIPAGVDETFQ